jgi:hypothetical protein
VLDRRTSFGVHTYSSTVGEVKNVVASGPGSGFARGCASGHERDVALQHEDFPVEIATIACRIFASGN